MNPILFGIVALTALLPIASAEDTALKVGPLEVRVVSSDMPNCLAAVAGIPCAAGYTDGGTADNVTDDEVIVYHAITSADARLTTGPLDQEQRFGPGETRVNHRIVNSMEAITIAGEAAIPSPMGDVTSTSSRETHGYLVLHLVGLQGTSVALADYYVPVGLPYSDRTGTYLINGWDADVGDSDLIVPAYLDFLRLCWIPQAGGETALSCDLLPGVQGVAADWPALTPRILDGLALNGTTVAVGHTTSEPNLNWAGRETTAQFLGGASGASQVVAPIDAQSGPPSSEPSLSHDWSRVPQSPQSPTAVVPQSAILATSIPPDSLLLVGTLVAAAVLPFVRLYQRITRERALRHSQRVRMLDLAKEEPGLLLARAASELGLSFHGARHHARMLQRCGHLDLVKAGGNVALYPRGVQDASLRGPLVGLRRGPQAEDLKRVAACPGLGVSELATLAGCAKSSAHAKLMRLKSQGLLDYSRRTGATATPLGLKALRALQRDEAGARLRAIRGENPSVGTPHESTQSGPLTNPP